MSETQAPARAAAVERPAPPVHLDLALPRALPGPPPGPAERAELGALIDAALDALAPRPEEARAQALAALLARLPDAGHAAAPVPGTGLPVSPEDVADFDGYFRVRRVAPARPALSLLRGLVQTAAAVAALMTRPGLSPARAEEQFAGFRAYALLLARTLDDAPAGERG
ncbi:siderophore biosynthesis protein [Oceanicella sp. SM1341]|uniref:siderophore biosynthesis protein n=1 Tax=Oceanicella sp. SM1341 TaxID=1548889 RepID=UPI000E471946|nr:siderophore biosynthesis protein [Oceanicella sp. SM1341]